MAMSKKKKKKLLGLIVLLLLAAVLFALVAVLGGKKDDDETESTSASAIKLFDFKNVDVLKLSYTYEGEKISFERQSKDDDWRLSGSDTGVDQTKVNNIVSTACAINRDREIGGNGLIKKDFGLDEPKAAISLTISGDKTYELFIGETTGTSDDNVYACLSDDESIFTMSGNILTKLEKDTSAFLKMQEYPTVKEEQITKITIKLGEKELVLFNDPEDLTEGEAIGSTTWYYKEDGIYKPLNQSNGKELITTITGVKFDSCVTNQATDKELEEYGLTEPSVEITVNYTVEDSKTEETDTTDANGSKYTSTVVKSNEAFTLLIGNKCISSSDNDSEGEFYYAALKGSGEICRIAAETKEFFTDKNMDDYILNLYPALCNFKGLTEITASYQGKSMRLSVDKRVETEDGEEKEVFDCRLNGETIDEKSARGVFAFFIKITADHIIKDEDIKDNEPCLIYTFKTSYDKKPEIRIEISELDDVYYQLSLNGSAKYAVTKQEFNTLISNISEYLK